MSKRVLNVPSIANVDDIWPEAPIQLGFLETPLLRYVSKQIGTHAFDNLDGITTISETI